MRGSTADNENSERDRSVPKGLKRSFLGVLVVILIAGLTGWGSGRPANAADRHHRTPGVKISSPQRRTTVHGTIVVDGTASGGAGVRSVRIRVTGLPHAQRATGTRHWSYTLDTTLLTDGPHTIKARVIAKHRNRSTTTIDINVANADVPPPPPVQPIVLGIWSDGVKGHTTSALESQIGRLFGGQRYNYKFMGTIPAKPGNLSFDAGRSMFYNNAESQDLNSRPIPWADIASGQYDDHLAEVVQAFAANPRWTNANPYLFSFHHEQDVAKGLGTFGTPSDYKAAFRHIFNYFQNAGILWRDGGQVKIVWDVTRNALNSGSAQAYDPDLAANGTTVVGDYYDVLGVDLYDKVQEDGHLGYTDPHQAFDPAHEYALARGKQFGVFELGVSEGKAGEKATFLSRIPSTLRSYGSGVPGSAMAVMYSNVTGKQVYYADSSPGALAAFITMANDPLFAS